MRRSTTPWSGWTWALPTALLLGAIPASGANPAQAEAPAESEAPAWLHRADVVFESAPNGWRVKLADGRELLVGLIAVRGGPMCQKISDWESGRRLVYAYDAEVGAVLIDVQSGCRLSVPLPDPHPIDLLETPPEGRTRYDLWDAELDRAYAQALEILEQSPGGDFGVLPGPEVAEALREAQRRWIAFRDAEVQALEALHSGGGQVGWQQVAGRRIELVRQRARWLVDYAWTER